MAARRKKRRSARAGCLLWLAALLVLLVLFLVKFNDIKAAVHKTGFLDALNHAVAEPNPKPAPAPSATATPAQETPSPGAKPEPAPAPFPAVRTEPSSSPPASSAQTNSTQSAPASPSAPAAAPPSNQSSATAEAPQKMRTASLYFVHIDDSGSISSQRVKRNIPLSDSPIQDTLEQLIKGPSESELRANLISLIPSGTKLRGISVRGSTAIVDFSDSFLYNRYGKEGYVAQLRQVVYTLTEFSNISDVQFLIDGKTRDFITEGVALTTPWARGSF